MSNMGHYHADSVEPMTVEELDLARKLMSDPMAVLQTPLIQYLLQFIQQQPCCGDNPARGNARALFVRSRAASWYGLGDGTTSLASTGGGSTTGVVKNYVLTSPAGDATFSDDHQLDTLADDIGTIGTPVTWSLAQDNGSFHGEPIDPAPYPNPPHGRYSVQTQDDLSTTADFTVNLWIRQPVATSGAAGPYNSFVSLFGVDDVFYPVSYYGRGAEGSPGANDGMRLGSIAQTNVANGANPGPDPIIFRCSDGLGTGTSYIDLTVMAENDGLYHMVTITYVAADRTFRSYVDGAQVDTQVFAGSDFALSTGPGRPLIGNADNNNFSGEIDEVGYWTEALGDADIAALFTG